MDVSSDPNRFFGRVGLIRFDGTLRPSYTALQRTLRFFKDIGRPADLSEVTIRAEGDAKFLRFSAFRRASGQTILAHWLEVVSKDTPDTRKIILTLPEGTNEAALYDPMAGDAPLWTRRVRDQKLEILASDRMQFLVLNP
jgi:hypothetical protein